MCAVRSPTSSVGSSPSVPATGSPRPGNADESRAGQRWIRRRFWRRGNSSKPACRPLERKTARDWPGNGLQDRRCSARRTVCALNVILRTNLLMTPLSGRRAPAGRWPPARRPARQTVPGCHLFDPRPRSPACPRRPGQVRMRVQSSAASAGSPPLPAAPGGSGYLRRRLHAGCAGLRRQIFWRLRLALAVLAERKSPSRSKTPTGRPPSDTASVVWTGMPMLPSPPPIEASPRSRPKSVVVQHRCVLDQQRHADNLATLRRDFARALENVVHGDPRVRQQPVRRVLLRALRKDHRKRRSGSLLPAPPNRLDPAPHPTVRMAAPAELPRRPVRFRIKMQPANRSCNRRRLRAKRPAPVGPQRLHSHPRVAPSLPLAQLCGKPRTAGAFRPNRFPEPLQRVRAKLSQTNLHTVVLCTIAVLSVR